MLICTVLYLMYTFNLMWNQYVHQVTSLNVCRTHLTGAIDHGHGVHCYIDLLTWPHDANLVINVQCSDGSHFEGREAPTSTLNTTRQYCQGDQEQVPNGLPGSDWSV